MTIVAFAMALPCAGCETLSKEVAELKMQLREVLKLVELQQADIDRIRGEASSAPPPPTPPPHKPERVPSDQLQLAFERVLASQEPDARAEVDVATDDEPDETTDDAEPTAPETRGGRTSKGRRRLDLTKLPVQDVVVDPEEVIEAHGEGFREMGAEVSERLAYRPGMFLRLRLVRRKWARIEPSVETSIAVARDGAEHVEPEAATVCVAPVPECLWPRAMADTSVIAHHIVAKYEDCLPLHRQEKISARQGFAISRGTQCGWLTEAHLLLAPIVEAMFRDAVSSSFCIAMDATSAPVRAKGSGECVPHHMFVFIADQRHVLFRHSSEHNGATVRAWLDGYHGYLLADAASIYDVMYREEPIVEVGCWAHLRRYFWRALGADPPRAAEALAIIGKLFDVQRASVSTPMPERTAQRAKRARPLLKMLDDWIARQRDQSDPRGPLRAAITYYENQRGALRRFLEDGRLRLDNNLSEGQLRRLVLGRSNWTFFANEAGLDWYATFRSLIASCVLHGLNPQEYLEQVLRLAPYWSPSRRLELSPLRWRVTLEKLDEDERAIITPLWELDRIVRPRSDSAVA